ncbi:type III-A CRISPR-associated protein Csm2 [Thermophagus xiamenensis]|uniref:CRISPR system Cms protein Csm2 n=1 Tax=Thermophagus xiamenensis TaxID=385682 RepID=A0A1I1VD39_9BACT|nr:type III-A CRISPR-associated protein Csm2 [Thermophagus xiamenensis]SFD80856.1 CRISPR-associated protein Csm2 [Thermophagus xiamenensis]
MVQKDLIFRNEPNTKGSKSGAGGKNSPEVPFSKRFKDEWITKGVNQETVSFADELGKYLKENNLTTSQIRNVFGEIKRIQIKGYEQEKPSFYLLKPKMAYAASRVDGFKSKGIKAFKEVFDLAHKNVIDDKTYKNFVDFFEAILAYHKSYGGRD